MLVSDILLRVQRTFGDTANIQIDQTDIIRWINDAQRDICLSNDLLQTIATVNSAIGTNVYTLPTDILTIRSVKYAGNKLMGLSLGDAEQNLPGFDDPTNYPSGIPTHFWIWANQFTLYPNPIGVDAIKIYYTRKPTDVAAVTDQPELPTQYHNRLVEYCLSQAYELDDNWTAAQAKKTEFTTGINNTRDENDWLARDFYPMVTSTDSDYTYYA